MLDPGEALLQRAVGPEHGTLLKLVVVLRVGHGRIVPCFPAALRRKAGRVVKPRVNGIAVIAVSSLFLGLMAVLTRLLAGQVPAVQVATVRFAVGVVGCGFLCLARRQRPALGQWKLLRLRGLWATSGA